MLAGQPTAIEVWVGGERGGSAEQQRQQLQQSQLSQPATLSRPATQAEIDASNPTREQFHLSDHARPSTTVSDTQSERLLQVAVPEITREIVKEVPKLVLKEVPVFKDKIVQNHTQQEVRSQPPASSCPPAAPLLHPTRPIQPSYSFSCFVRRHCLESTMNIANTL